MAKKSSEQHQQAQKGAVPNSDLAVFHDFQRQWNDGTLTTDHPVIASVTKWARMVAYKNNCPERADDLTHRALIYLASSSYKGEATLDTYIMRILLHSNTAEWRKSGGTEQTQLSAESADKKSQKFFEEVLRRVSSDKLMKELLMTRPELQRTIVLIILDAEKRPGRRRLAEMASQRLGRIVTRFEVDVALEQLREAVRQFSSHPKASGPDIERIPLNSSIDQWRKRGGKRRGELINEIVDMEESLKVAAQIRQELTGQKHSDSTELVAEDRRR